jgi:hypothetical protein
MYDLTIRIHSEKRVTQRKGDVQKEAEFVMIALKMEEGVTTWEYKWLLEARTDLAMDLPLEPPKGRQLC